MIPFAKTVESPCRKCENIGEDKEECAKDCAKLNAFQAAILRRDEISIKNFQVRYPVFAGKQRINKAPNLPKPGEGFHPDKVC